jgi:hypothetical protein
VRGYDSYRPFHRDHHRRIAVADEGGVVVVDNVDDNVPVDQHSDSTMLSP